VGISFPSHLLLLFLSSRRILVKHDAIDVAGIMLLLVHLHPSLCGIGRRKAPLAVFILQSRAFMGS
jgi:hypothetical protein